MKTYKDHFIDNEWVEVTGEQDLVLHDPWTGGSSSRVQFGSAADVDLAVAAAKRALPSWSQTTAVERRDVLLSLASELEKRVDDIAAAVTAEVGTPPKVSRALQAMLPVHDLHAYAEAIEEAMRVEISRNSRILSTGVGVVAAITPWNYPIHQAIAKVGGALAAGCTVVVKPSELVPESMRLLAEAVQAALPEGVVNLLLGGAELGGQLIRHEDIDALSFTGSTAVGKIVSRAAAERLIPVHLELGGKSPSVILPGADLRRAVDGSLKSGFLNSGQTCTGLTRLLVHRADLQEVRGYVAESVAQVEPKLGPLVSKDQFERVQQLIKRAVESGAETIAGGPGRPEARDTGWFVRPTVFLVEDSDAEIVQSEVFGPVVVVQPYDSIDEAVQLANGTQYALAAAVWGDNEGAEDVAVQLKAGQIDLNGAAFNPAAPFGGFKKSGHGRELGIHGIRAFQAVTSIQR